MTMQSKFVLALAALSVLPAGASAHGRGHAKLLKDAAAALQPINPELSASMKKLASKASDRKAERMYETDEIAQVRQAASDLRSARPDLAKDLDRFADKEAGENRKDSSERKGMTSPRQVPGGGY